MPDAGPPQTPDVDRRLVPGIVVIVSLLAATSGIVDVVAFQRFGVFVANQTGNLVIVALSLTSGQDSPTRIASLVALVAFTIGVFLAVWLRTRLRRRLPVARVRVILLGLEATLIAIVAAGVVLLGQDEITYASVALLSLSQAVQAVIITRIVGVSVQTVVINTALVQSANWWFEGLRKASGIAFATPVGYLVGAAIGAILVQLPAPTALASALVTVAATAVVARRIVRSGATLD